jgi:4-amino-4-deoxy-L-arabinose transferase-like glycosyltransferase
MAAALAVVAGLVTALVASNKEAILIPAFVAAVFIALALLFRLAKKNRMKARVLAWVVRVVSVPVLTGFCLVVFFISPINNKLYVQFTEWDYVRAWIWNGILILAACALWWLLHTELNRAINNEDRG